MNDVIRAYRMTVVLSPRLGLRELQALLRPLAIVAPSEAVSADIFQDIEVLGGPGFPRGIYATTVERHLVLDSDRHVLSYNQSALVKHESIVMRVAANLAPHATRGFHVSVGAQALHINARHYFGPTPAHIQHHEHQTRIEDAIWQLPTKLGEEEIVRAMLRKFFNVVGDEPVDPNATPRRRIAVALTDYTATELERVSEALENAPKDRAVDGYVRRDGISTHVFADEVNEEEGRHE